MTDNWKCECGKQKSSTTHTKCRDCKIKDNKEVLDALKKEFGEPVFPLSFFCDSITSWARCIEQGVRENTDGHQHGKNYAEYINQLLIDIRKSGLLDRLIYQGQEVRTEKCPIHNGHMDTAMWCFQGGEICCDGSGWLETDLTVRAVRRKWFLDRLLPNGNVIEEWQGIDGVTKKEVIRWKNGFGYTQEQKDKVLALQATLNPDGTTKLSS